MTHRIVFIDDEENILLSLKRLFRTSPFEFNYFLSGGDALEFLKENSASVIVSDMKMPVMSGIEFLEKAKLIAPDSVRIILSGYSEADRIMDAINKGSIWRFIPKPWNNDELKMTIRNAVDLYQQLTERKQLTEELREKTALLDEMNRLLEKKVEERTWRLKERTRILNMLLDDEDVDVIIIQICTVLSEIIGGATVWVRADYSGRLYSSAGGESGLPRGLAAAEKKARKAREQLCNGGDTVVLLRKGETLLGTLMFSCDECAGGDVCEQVSGFASLLDVALFQYQSLESAPELMENLDKLIGSI